MNLKKLLLPLLSVSLLAAPVSTGYAAETNVAVAETEQGTLSPSSEKSAISDSCNLAEHQLQTSQSQTKHFRHS